MWLPRWVSELSYINRIRLDWVTETGRIAARLIYLARRSLYASVFHFAMDNVDEASRSHSCCD